MPAPKFKALAVIDQALKKYHYLPCGQSDVVKISDRFDQTLDSAQPGFEYALDEIRSDGTISFEEQRLISALWDVRSILLNSREALERDYAQELKKLKFTKAQTAFLQSCWDDLASGPDQPLGIIKANTNMGGEREDTNMMNSLAKKGILTFEHHELGTEFTFLKDTPVPGIYKG